MRKKGLSHIEVILSFVLFMSAVIFMFYFFRTVEPGKMDEGSARLVLDYIEGNATVNLIEISVSPEAPGQIGDTFGIRIDNYFDELSNAGVYALEKNGAGIRSYFVPTGSKIICINGDESVWAKGLFYIYLSEGIIDTETPTSCSETDDNYYVLGAVYEREVVSEKKLKEIAQRYDDYENLKSQMGLSAMEDFDFKIDLLINPIEKSKTAPSTEEVTAYSKDIEVLREDGRVEFAKVSVRTW